MSSSDTRMRVLNLFNVRNHDLARVESRAASEPLGTHNFSPSSSGSRLRALLPQEAVRMTVQMNATYGYLASPYPSLENQAEGKE